MQYILVGKNKAQTAADLKAQGKDPKKDKDAAKQIAAAYDDPKKTAQEIYDQLKGGAKFAALAKKYSHDDSTKNTGGKLTAQKGQLVPKFNTVAFTMKTGALSKPFETPEYGWFVVKANSAREEHDREGRRRDDPADAAADGPERRDDRVGRQPREEHLHGRRRSRTRSATRRTPIRASQYQRRDDHDRVVALSDALVELQELTERLRRECPWDREQTERTIVPHTVEEAYEVADAALAGDDAKLLDELGDLLFQTYFLALLLSERGAGDLEAVARGDPREARRAPPARVRRRRGADRRPRARELGAAEGRAGGARGRLPRRARGAAGAAATRARCSGARRRSASTGPTSPGALAEARRGAARAARPRSPTRARRRPRASPIRASRTSSATCCSRPSTSRGG